MKATFSRPMLTFAIGKTMISPIGNLEYYITIDPY